MAKIITITGGSRGIGAATARMAAMQGYDVAIGYANNKDSAERVANDIRATGRRTIVVRCNVAVEAEVMALFETVDQQLGGTHVLINSAGIVVGGGPILLFRARGYDCFAYAALDQVA